MSLCSQYSFAASFPSLSVTTSFAELTLTIASVMVRSQVGCSDCCPHSGNRFRYVSASIFYVCFPCHMFHAPCMLALMNVPLFLGDSPDFFRARLFRLLPSFGELIQVCFRLFLVSIFAATGSMSHVCLCSCVCLFFFRASHDFSSDIGSGIVGGGPLNLQKQTYVLATLSTGTWSPCFY